MAGYGTALLGGMGALRLLDFPELARWTGRGVARTAMSEGTAWYWACYIIIILIGE